MNALACCLALLLLGCAPASAHWLDHDELPDWARRGIVQWGHGANIDGRIRWTGGGFGVDRANAELLLFCGRTLQQTIGYLEPETERLARAGGLRRQPYICSQTVWWKREYPADPGLDQAVRRTLDGQPLIIYDNPDRHCGCYNNPRWLETMKRRVNATIEGVGGKVDSIFFDNPLPYDCYCDYCRDKFRAFTRERFDQAMELTATEAPGYRLAKAWFQAESLRAFFDQVKAHIRSFDPTITISPNMGVGSAVSNYVNAIGTTDMVFCENGFTMPPDQSTVVDYKLGLAASHGRATGQLLGLSEMLRRTRALSLDPHNEAGILESFVYPEEHQLAFAEALACDGSYIVSFALREQKISVGDLPHHVHNREAIHRYAAFEKQHRELYALAQPGGEVAVLYSVWTHLGQGHSATAFRAACTALGRAGVPYEVLVEEDLTPAQLGGYRAVVLPQVTALSADDAATLLEYARGGGALVVVGNAARTDRLGSAHSSVPLPDELPNGKLWRVADLAEIPPARLAEEIERRTGGLTCRVTTAAPRVFANLLRTADGRRSVHLVNSDFAYTLPASTDIRDDSGQAGGRSFLAATAWRMRKTLLLPADAPRPDVLRFFGNACFAATDAMQVVVSLNSRVLATYPGSSLRESKWHEIPLPEGLLQPANEVVFQATGKPNGHPDWFALKIDTTATTRRSSWSADDGRTWTETDLSLDPGTQAGEFLVRFGAAADPAAVARPEDFMGRLPARPAREVAVVVRGDSTAPARLLSPDAPEQAIAPKLADGLATYLVPELPIYAVLVLP